MRLNFKWRLVVNMRYSSSDRGFIKAWGDTLYLGYHDLPLRSRTQSREQVMLDMEELDRVPENGDEWEEILDWLVDGGSRNKIPLWNKTTLTQFYKEIAEKSPLKEDLIVYRTSEEELPGLNSYTVDKGAYLNWHVDNSIERAYKIPKGETIIYASGLADEGEMIWAPTVDQLKEYKI